MTSMFYLLEADMRDVKATLGRLEPLMIFSSTGAAEFDAAPPGHQGGID